MKTILLYILYPFLALGGFLLSLVLFVIKRTSVKNNKVYYSTTEETYGN